MTTLILWIVYNPHTGECVYYGTDNAAARAALNERNLMKGFVCHPVTAEVTAPAPRTRKKAAK